MKKGFIRFFLLRRRIMGIPQNLLLNLKRWFIGICRMIELALTGEAHFQLHTEDGVVYDKVTELFNAREIVEDTKIFLRRNFGIVLKKPVFIKLVSGEEFNLKGIILELRGVQGHYHYENLGKNGMAHMVYMQKGLDKKRFFGILAHELTHAFLRENQLMGTDRYLREGFARWIEYKTFLSLGLTQEAEKILKLQTLKHGKAVEKFIKLEQKVGALKAMEIIRKVQ